jgi:hypothetical protein
MLILARFSYCPLLPPGAEVWGYAAIYSPVPISDHASGKTGGLA